MKILIIQEAGRNEEKRREDQTKGGIAQREGNKSLGIQNQALIQQQQWNTEVVQ